MKKQLLIFPLLCFLIILSCKKNENHTLEINNKETPKNSKEVPGNRFENNVYNFNYADDWSITDREEIEAGIYYVALEKNGMDASGLMTIISYEEVIDLDASIMMNIEELQNNSVVNNLNYDPLQDSTFNSIKSRSSNFTFKTMEIEHDGIIYAFSSTTNSVVIFKQEALEDKKENIEGFDTIENSFEIK